MKPKCQAKLKGLERLRVSWMDIGLVKNSRAYLDQRNIDIVSFA